MIKRISLLLLLLFLFVFASCDSNSGVWECSINEFNSANMVFDRAPEIMEDYTAASEKAVADGEKVGRNYASESGKTSIYYIDKNTVDYTAKGYESDGYSLKERKYSIDVPENRVISLYVNIQNSDGKSAILEGKAQSDNEFSLYLNGNRVEDVGPSLIGVSVSLESI